jgi:Uma2 family endonuclease
MSTVSTITPPASSEWDPSPESIYRLTVDQYEAMVASGVFTKRDRFHLINGILVKKMTQYPPHAASCETTRLSLEPLLRQGWHIRGDKPLRIPKQSSVPEPDLVITRGSSRDYFKRHPGPADVALVIEVSDSSLKEDRKLAQVYAGGGVRVYWIVNLIDGQVEVYTRPSQKGYRSHRDFTRGQVVPVIIDGVEVGQLAVSAILP